MLEEFPVYDHVTDGNRFDWILSAAESVRATRRAETEAAWKKNQQEYARRQAQRLNEREGVDYE